MKEFNWIINESNVPWLELDIKFPYEEMHKEAINLKDRFVKHRDQDGQGGYRHKGWRSLCIHGIDAEKLITMKNMVISQIKKHHIIGLI